MNIEREFLYENRQEATNGATWSFNKCWECAVQHYGLPFLHYCISNIYTVYTYCTPLNVALFLVKSLPTGVYVFNFVKGIYVTSRERMKLKQIELEDLQLQIHIVNTKLSVRDAEFTERALELRRSTERLRRVRAKVREVIAADDELKRSLHETGPWEDDSDIDINAPPEEREFIVQLLKELKYDQVAVGETSTEMSQGEMMGAREPPARSSTPGESVYSSANDADVKQNCRVKIVKVTNVYKVAYLKHYIKRKKLRRATKHAILKKKMESIKKLLDDWQKTLSMVINCKPSIFNMDSQYVEIASQEAMGDCTKQDLRESSDSESDCKNFNDNYYEQSSFHWPRNAYGNFKSGFEDNPDIAVPKDMNQFDRFDRFKYSPRTTNMLYILPEEAGSQVAIEEVKSEAVEETRSDEMEEVRSEASDEYECRGTASM